MHLVAAPDKFRGTLSASEAAQAMANGARDLGWTARERPLADGGEGSLEVLGGSNPRAPRLVRSARPSSRDGDSRTSSR